MSAEFSTLEYGEGSGSQRSEALVGPYLWVNLPDQSKISLTGTGPVDRCPSKDSAPPISPPLWVDSTSGIPSQRWTKDAVIFSNWWPSTSDVMGRKGFQDWATGLPSTVESLFDYNPSSGAYELFAASGSAFYDVTNTGAVGSGRLWPVKCQMAAHEHGYSRRGVSVLLQWGWISPQLYNGAMWQAVTGASVPIAITG